MRSNIKEKQPLKRKEESKGDNFLDDKVREFISKWNKRRVVRNSNNSTVKVGDLKGVFKVLDSILSSLNIDYDKENQDTIFDQFKIKLRGKLKNKKPIDQKKITAYKQLTGYAQACKASKIPEEERIVEILRSGLPNPKLLFDSMGEDSLSKKFINTALKLKKPDTNIDSPIIEASKDKEVDKDKESYVFV